MTNSYRLQAVGSTYHVNTKAVAGMKAFPRTWHRDVFLRMLARECERSSWVCLGYAILGTHYHAVIRLRKLTLSSGVQHLNSGYARWFNREHGRTGALWQRRFHDRPVETDSHLLELQRYLAHNATRANLSDTPEEWPYCHYGAMIGVHPPDPLVSEADILELISFNRRVARRQLRNFVEERDPRVRRQTLLRRRSDAEK
jgi:hypothetical protein